MFGGPAGYQSVSYASYPPQQQQPNILHGPPGLMDPRPQPPTPNSASPSSASLSASSTLQQQQFLTPPAPHGLSSLAAAVDHSPSSASSSSHHSSSHHRDDDDSSQQFNLGRSRSRSPGRAPASHHQISQKRKEAHRIEYSKHMKTFWAKQKELIERTDYKRLKHDLPLARIKKIMKSDDEVRMISAEVPILFSKACELFILDLTMRAWAHTADTNRRTLQRSDVADAISEGEGMDFLVDIVPREDDVIAGGIGTGGGGLGSMEKREAGESDGKGRREEALPGVLEDAGMTTEGLLKLMEREMNGGDRRSEQNSPQSQQSQQSQQQQPQAAQAMPAMQSMAMASMTMPPMPLIPMPMPPMPSMMPPIPLPGMPAPAQSPAAISKQP